MTEEPDRFNEMLDRLKEAVASNERSRIMKHFERLIEPTFNIGSQRAERMFREAVESGK